ncbi:hypothetical protein WME75_23760 [Sorangium sp. So ce1014]|uniref:hypothetical protein n=1 Tax=Sorangium sp. So ce1014 TaxID=3133326 RepID=UPI003F5EBDEE
MAVDVSPAGALQRRVDLQARLWQAAHTTCRGTGKDACGRQLHRDILSYLLKASDQRILRESPDVIRKHLRFMGPDADGYFGVTVGTVRNFNRTRDLPHFTRRDGGWFDFQLQVNGQAEIIAYDFELRLPTDSGFDFLRFDLNPHGRGQDDDGLRSHLHLNSDDDGLAAPAPVMSPFEILDLFLHGLRRGERVRRSPVASAGR